MGDLKVEIGQGRPFSSVAEEALLNLMRSSDCLHRAMQRKTKTWGVTTTQYNALRILRGAQPQGLTCSGIGERMITAEPDITRLLARLKVMKLVKQQRGTHDRRVVWTHIAATGLALLAEMDPVVQQFPVEMLGHLGEKELTRLIRLLELARKNCQDSQAPVRCSGEQGGVSCEKSEAAKIEEKGAPKKASGAAGLSGL